METKNHNNVVSVGLLTIMLIFIVAFFSCLPSIEMEEYKCLGRIVSFHSIDCDASIFNVEFSHGDGLTVYEYELDRYCRLRRNHYIYEHNCVKDTCKYRVLKEKCDLGDFYIFSNGEMNKSLKSIE